MTDTTRELHDPAALDGPGPSKALAGIAAAMPFAFTLSCCVAVPFAVGSGNPVEVASTMGAFFWLVSGVALVAPIASGVVLFLAGLGKRVPSVLAIGFAGLPWLVGLAGTRYGMYNAEQAVQFAEPSMRAMLLARGVGEASLAHVYGASVSVGMLVGVALGLALAAIGQRAPGRRLPAAALALTTLPLLAAAGWLFSIWLIQGPLTPLGVALAAFVVTGLSGAAVGRDAPRHRSGALAVASVAAVTLAFVAAASAASTRALVEVFSALAMADPAMRTSLILSAAHDVAPYRTVAEFGLLIGALPLLAMAGWAASRKAPSAGGLVGGAAVALCLIAYPVLDSVAIGGGAAAMARAARPAWVDVEGFEPVSLEGLSTSGRPRAFLMADQLVPWDDLGTRMAVADATGLSGRIRELVERPGPGDGFDAGFVDAPPPGDGYALIAAPSFGVAVDRRAPLETLRALLEGARGAGVRQVVVVGAAGDAMTDADRESVEAGLPLLAFIAESQSGVALYLPDAVSPDGPWHPGSPVLHGVVGPSPDVTLTSPWPGGRGDYHLGEARGFESEHGLVYLELGEGATAASYLRAASRAERAGFEVVAALDGPPRGSPLADIGALVDGLDGLDGLDVAGVMDMLGRLAGEQPGAGETDTIYDRGIRDAGDGEFLVTAEAIEHGSSQWMRSGRIVPDMEGGQVVGLNIFGIRRGTLFDRLGLRNGDSIRSIGGRPVRGVDATLAAYAAAQGSDNVVVVLDRRGRTLTHRYRLVERLP